MLISLVENDADKCIFNKTMLHLHFLHTFEKTCLQKNDCPTVRKQLGEWQDDVKMTKIASNNKPVTVTHLYTKLPSFVPICVLRVVTKEFVTT